MISIDDRAGSAELIHYFPSKHVTLTRMEYGDIAFEGKGPDGPIRIGIEVKKIKDLLGSMQSGRLAGHQLPGMIGTYDRLYIFVDAGGLGLGKFCGVDKEQEYKRRVKGGTTIPYKIGQSVFTDTQQVSFQYSLTEFFGASYKQFRTEQAMCRAIWILYQWWNKPYSKHGTGSVIYNSASAGWTGRVSPLVKIAACIPGIGSTKAKLVGKEFKSFEDMIRAGKLRWMRIEGVGEKSALSIMKFLRDGNMSPPE